MKIFILGCDGYIGNALTQRLLNKGHEVYGFDNFYRRKCVEKVKSISAIPILSMKEKEKKFNEIYKGNFIFNEWDIVNDDLDYLMNLFKPDCIVNIAQNASAPYSMASKEQAKEVLLNNVIPTNSILWGIKKHCPNCHYVTIGSAGEYCHNANIDIEEGYFSFEYNGRKSTELMYPRQGNSLYHCSKISSSYIIDYLARIWELRITDIQQGVVFGGFTDETENNKIFSRLDFDESFGTCINRFIVQAILGIPLTIYGEGKHQRSFISLNDSVQALELLINSSDNIIPGKVRSVNQMSEWWNINDIANMVIEVGKKLGINVTSQHIDTPRNEHTGEHYYNFITNKLKEVGYKPTRTIKEEVEYCLNILIGLKGRLEPYRNVVIPKINFKEIK